MKVKKDTILKINHNRKGVFLAKAIKDFDTETTDYMVCDICGETMKKFKSKLIDTQEIN